MLVYLITTPTGGVYVGRTTNFNQRMTSHARKSHNIRLRRSIKKYGWNKHKVNVLKHYTCENEYTKGELFYIEKYLKSHGKRKVFNSIKVEQGITIFDKEHRKKLSDSHIKFHKNGGVASRLGSGSLKESDLTGILQLVKTGYSLVEVSEMLGVKYTAIRSWTKGNAYKNIGQNILKELKPLISTNSYNRRRIGTGTLQNSHISATLFCAEKGYVLSEISSIINVSRSILNNWIYGNGYKYLSQQQLPKIKELLKNNNNNKLKNRYLHKGKLVPHLPEIISMIEEGYTLTDIGKKLNYCRRQVNAIFLGDTYKGLIPEEKLIELQKLIKETKKLKSSKTHKGKGKLTEHIQEVRDLLEASYKQTEIAKYFGISLSTINGIKTGRLYTNL